MRKKWDIFVDKTDSCWNWIGNKGNHGYGYFYLEPQIQVLAHRFFWERANGAIPLGLCVLHKCDNRLCVRPAHLFLGTRAENSRDMVQKGRSVKSSLPSTVIRDIRKRRHLGETYASISRAVGVGFWTVRDIAKSRRGMYANVS